MKVALLGESPADEAVLRVLVGAVLGAPPKFVQAGLRARGWPNVVQLLPAVIRHLHFNTDADTLVVTCDSDDSVVHTPAHEAPNYFHPQCRLCQLRAVFRQTTKKLPPARGRARVLRAVGVAVPALEAWLLCGRDNGVGEAAWIAAPGSGGPRPSRRELKWRVYGTDRPTLPQEIDCALKEVARHAWDTRRLEFDFPGFEALARDLRENRDKINS
jgi:hypothetical protein